MTYVPKETSDSLVSGVRPEPKIQNYLFDVDEGPLCLGPPDETHTSRKPSCVPTVVLVHMYTDTYNRVRTRVYSQVRECNCSHTPVTLVLSLVKVHGHPQTLTFDVCTLRLVHLHTLVSSSTKILSKGQGVPFNVHRVVGSTL